MVGGAYSTHYRTEKGEECYTEGDSKVGRNEAAVPRHHPLIAEPFQPHTPKAGATHF